MSASRWLTWTPSRRTIDITGKHLESASPKPPKILFEGSGGRFWDNPSISEERLHKNGRDNRVHQRPVTLDPLWGEPLSMWRPRLAPDSTESQSAMRDLRSRGLFRLSRQREQVNNAEK
jgi:hypothetical protein